MNSEILFWWSTLGWANSYRKALSLFRTMDCASVPILDASDLSRPNVVTSMIPRIFQWLADPAKA